MFFGLITHRTLGFNPEPTTVRNGRRFLYDAASFSAHGTVSCASCHLNGHRDGQAWDLGNPQGSVDTVNTITGPAGDHPMKGPMVTLTLQDIITHEPFHWRGDRDGIEQFESTFTNLLNHPNFAPPPTNVTSSSFGIVQSVQSAENSGNRTGQVSLRLDF